MRPLHIAPRALAALVAAQLVAAASLPCPPHADERDQPERAVLAAYAAGAPHPTHGMGDAHDTAAARSRSDGSSELRAPCPCPCSEAPAGGGLAEARLGAALLRAPAELATPSGSAPLAAEAVRLVASPSATPDPVPRSA